MEIGTHCNTGLKRVCCPVASNVEWQDFGVLENYTVKTDENFQTSQFHHVNMITSVTNVILTLVYLCNVAVNN